MPQNSSGSSGGPTASRARTIASLILLFVVGSVCFVELRAGVGHYITAKALKAKCNDVDEFQNLTLSDAQAMVRFPTSVEEIKQDNDSSYRYTWYSLLRPVMGDSSPTLTIVATKGDLPMALSFHTESGDDVPPVIPGAPADASGPSGMMGGPPGGMRGGGGGPSGPGGMMGGPGGPGGMMGGPGGGRGPRQRPPVEGDEPSETPPAHGAAKADSGDAAAPPASEAPASEKPAGETPGPDTPAAEVPATEKPPAGEAPATDAPAEAPK